MKKISLVLCLCSSFAVSALQAAPTPVNWLTSLPDAEAQAQKENKLVFVDFTGSDWCAACKEIDAEIFSKPAFADYARAHLVLVQLDFPADKPQPAALKAANTALQDKYKVEGFPTLMLLKPDGKILFTLQGSGELGDGPDKLIAKFKQAQEH